MGSKREQLLELLEEAEGLGLPAPAGVLLQLFRSETEEMIKESGTPSETIPVFSLVRDGLVPAPRQSGLTLMSDGWQRIATSLSQFSVGGGGGGMQKHNLLSGYHADTTADSPTRGDIITAQGVTPKWSKYSISVPAAGLMNYLGVGNGDTEPSYKPLFDNTNPANLGVAAPGTSLIGARQDHVHLATPGVLGNGAMQYQVIVTGPNPFVPVFSGFLLDGTTGGKTVLAVTNTKTLTLTSTGDFNLTIPATGTAALLGTANVFTTQQMVDGTSDQIQLRVQGHSTQTTNLQTWENSSGTVLSYIDGLGKLSVNSATAMDATTGYVFRASRTLTATSGSDNRVALVSGTLSPTGASSANFESLYVVAQANATSYNLTGSIYGSYYQVYTWGSNNVTYINGHNILVEHYGSGTLSNAIGAQGYIVIRAGGGNISNATGFISTLVIQEAKTVTNYYGFNVSTPSVGTGAITNAYGLYVNNINTASTLNYAIYTKAGAVRLGDTTTTTGRKRAVVTKTADYTATTNDEVIVCNSTTAFTVTLPVASGSGQTYHIKSINTGAITVSKSGDTIDGETSMILNQWDSIIICDYAANKWCIM